MSLINQEYGSQRQEVINWLIAHNYPALPVAPSQEPRKYHKVVTTDPEKGWWQHCPLERETLQPIPLFTGKNPSYLDKSGKPHLVNHRQYQNRLPSKKELKAWFTNQSNGIGTLGGWHNTVWLDFDVKKFSSQIECGEVAEEIALNVRSHLGSEPFLERSHSGGWRIGVRVKQKPDFTNFALTPGGAHVGEALFEGRFTVLAPTIGPSGNPYESLNRVNPPEIESLESIGVYSTKSSRQKEQRQDSTEPSLNFEAIPGTIPLEELGNRTSREILAGGNPSCDRSASLTTALNEWYGWLHWTAHNGVGISGNPEELAHGAGQRLGLDEDRINRILKSVSGDVSLEPAALRRGGEESCWKKIYRLDKATFEAKCPAHIKDVIKRELGSGMGRGGSSSVGSRLGSGSGSGGVTNCDCAPSPALCDCAKRTALCNRDKGRNERFSLDVGLNTDALRNEIRDILARSSSLSPSQIEASKIRLRLAHAGILTEREINKLFDEVAKELEHEELCDERRTDVDNLLKLGDQSLNLGDFLPPDLAQPLNRLSEFMNIRPEVGLTSLLVAVSSLHKVQTELVINRTQGFSVPPTIFAGLVSESGQKKSPILKAIVRKPLSVLQQEKREAFQQAIAQYEDEIAAWDKCKPDERKQKFPNGKPKKPQQRLYYFTNSTGEGMLYQFQAHPDKALLALVDELVGLFNSQNKYSGGRGSDRQDILSAFDGSGATVLRADGTRADLDGLLLSIFGTIQPEILKRLMKDCSDPDGQWARFLFVLQPLAAATLPEEDGGSFDLTARLLDYYRRIDRLPAREYRLSREAYKRYKLIYDQLERLRVSHPNAGMRAVYSKMEGYIGRLALNLHVLWELSAGKTVPDEEISLAIIEMAIALAKFYIGQVRIIHANADQTDLAPHMAKLVQHSKLLESIGKDGWVRDRDYQRSFNKQPRIDEARSWMREAEALSFGRTRKAGRNGLALEFHWRLSGEDDNSPRPPRSPDAKRNSAVSGLSVGSPTNEPLEIKGIETIVSAVSADLVFPEEASIPQTVPMCATQLGVSEQENPLTTLTNTSEQEPVGNSLVSDDRGQAKEEALTEPVEKLKEATLRATVAACEAAFPVAKQPAQLNICQSEPIPEISRSEELSSAQAESAWSVQPSQPAQKAVHESALETGERVCYCGNNPDWQHYKRVTMTVVGLASSSAGSSDYDMITCRLPGGATNDFLRNTLKRVLPD